MKRGTINHPKVKELSRLLGISRRDTLGLLTLLWDWTGDYAPDGCIGRMSIEQIAEAVEWPASDAQKLIDGLVNSGLVDKVSKKSGKYVIHDWFEHCEQWVRKRFERRLLTKFGASGRCPDGVRTMDSLPEARSPKPVTEAESPVLIPKPEPEAEAPCEAQAVAVDSPHPAESASPSVGVSQGPSVSVSADPQTLRQRARIRYELAVHPLIGRDGPRRHPKGSPQHEADMTCVRDWWERDIWPPDDPPEIGAERLRQFEGFVRQVRDRGDGIEKPMAWLNRKLHPKGVNTNA